MAVQIKIDQPGSGAPPGVAGVAREDLVIGFGVLLTAVGGPFGAYQWSIIDKAVNITAGVQSAALLGAPAAAVTSLAPIDQIGTYLVQVVVDSGSGLGATPGDIATLTFYAGAVLNNLNPDPTKRPRRQMAFRETTQHNVADPVFPLGNPRGWAEEWERWLAVLRSLFARPTIFAWARVSLPPGGPAALVSGVNVGPVLRLSKGVVSVAFTAAAPSALYAVQPGARIDGGMFLVRNEAVGGFVIERSDLGGSLLDQDFSFVVEV